MKEDGESMSEEAINRIHQGLLDKHMEERHGATACDSCGEINPYAQTQDTCPECLAIDGDGPCPDEALEAMKEDGSHWRMHG